MSLRFSIWTRFRVFVPAAIALFILAGFNCVEGSNEGDKPSSPEAQQTITIASFNIQVFGQTKAGKPDVMTTLAKVAREFDVMVVQEFRDASEQTADIFLDRINQDVLPAHR